MQANIRVIKKRRKFSQEFKKKIVSDFESSKFSVSQLCKLYGLSYQSVYNWIYKFSTFNDKEYQIVEHKTSSTQKLKELEEKVKNLEAMLGRKQIMIDYLETMMDVAKTELGVDIKKNYGTQPCKNSKSKKKK